MSKCPVHNVRYVPAYNVRYVPVHNVRYILPYNVRYVPAYNVRYVLAYNVRYVQISLYLTIITSIKWYKIFKNGPSKICGRQPLKNLKSYVLPKQTISLQFF